MSVENNCIIRAGRDSVIICWWGQDHAGLEPWLNIRFWVHLDQTTTAKSVRLSKSEARDLAKFIREGCPPEAPEPNVEDVLTRRGYGG